MLMDEKAQYIKEEANKAYNDLRISLLQKGEAIYLTAFGGSMYPFIKNGDEIKIEPVSAEGIKVGDIVAVDRGTENSPRFLVHRVVMIKGGGPEKVYFTKGDAHNNKTLEGPVAIGSIIGTAARIKRRGLDIDLQTSLWRHLDRYVGWLSLKYPEILIYLSACVNIILERRSLLAKVKKRLKSGDPVICNTEKLILICARKDPSDELIKEAQELIGDGVDWEQFCRLAFKSQAAVLVYNSLKSRNMYLTS
ncbi:MAG: S26 family signal peptidase, partial [Candidatus Omnitrophica bacterium]|nr:S26 family signal peptidase [Candidatus Omnitrophota bacterium]